MFFNVICGMCTECHGLFVLSLSVIDRLFSVIMAFPGHLQYYFSFSLRKHAFSNILKILSPKNENLQIKNMFLLKTLIVGTR